MPRAPSAPSGARGPRSFGDVDAGSSAERALALLVLDAQAQHPAVRRLRAWAAERLDPQPGARVVDVGCGPGDEVLGLALVVGRDGDAVGVDVSAAMVAEAQRRAEALSRPLAAARPRFLVGSATALPLEAASVDALRCERVLQHVEDPAACVAEAARVLRPGGRVVLLDTDWRSLVAWPGDPATTAALREAWLRGFANPAAGSQLPDLLVRAGLEDVEVTTEVLAVRPRTDQLRPPLPLMLEAAVRDGLVTADAAQAWSAEVRRASAEGRFLSAVIMVGAAARRPRTEPPEAAPP